MGRTRKIRLKGGAPKRKAPSSGLETQDDSAKRARTDEGPPPLFSLNPCSDPITQSFMALHLKADIKHDHGDINVDQIIGPVIPLPSLSEESVKNYILDNFVGEQTDLRKNKTVNFSLAQKTDFFSQYGVSPIFSPFDGVSNDKVGVVQDAGIKLYELLGAVNILTFGSILDQAGKPKENAYYQVSDKTINIPLCIFGFDKSKVSNITISNFTGTSVDYSFDYNGESKGGTVELNKVGSDFQSIDQIRKMPMGNEKVRAIIGKALGDALQVASLTSIYAGDLYPRSVKPLVGDETREIHRVLFNTGDQLAHARAYVFGVPSVYSAPRDKNGIRNFEYLPGVEKLVSMAKYYSKAMKDVCRTINKSYTDLILHLTRDVRANIVILSAYNDVSLIPADKAGIAVQYIDRLIANITKIQGYVNAYCTEMAKTLTPESYNKLLKESINLTPSSTRTLARGGKNVLLTLTLLKPRSPILVNNVEVIPAGTYTWNVYETYKQIGRGAKIDDRQMKVFTMFGNDPPLPNGPALGGQKIEEVFGIPFSGPTTEIRIEKTEPFEEYLNESYLPFASEMKWQEVCEAYETYKLYPDSIIDITLLEALYNEYASISGDEPIQIERTSSKDKVSAHTISSLKFNAFACKFNATIAGEDTELGKDLLEYASVFEKLIAKEEPVHDSYESETEATVTVDHSSQPYASPIRSHGVQSMFLSPPTSQHTSYGGQRVSRENFSIDPTKSFVRTG